MSAIFEPLAAAESELIRAGWEPINGGAVQSWRHSAYPRAEFSTVEAIRAMCREVRL